MRGRVVYAAELMWLVAGLTADAAGQCPRLDAVWSALQPVAEPSIASAPPIILADLGESFRVTINGQQREYRDLVRDCARRARLAAVFVAIALGLPPPAPAEGPEVAIRARDAAPAPAPGGRVPNVQLEVSGAAEAGLASGYRVTLVGAGARVTLGPGRWKLVAGAALLGAGDAAVAPLTVGYTHVPIDVGVRVDGRVSHLEGSLEAGGAIGLLWLRGNGVVRSASDRVLEWGGRAGASLRYRAWARVAPFIAGGAQVVALPAELQVLPRGNIGRAPRLWLAASAGASVAF